MELGHLIAIVCGCVWVCGVWVLVTLFMKSSCGHSNCKKFIPWSFGFQLAFLSVGFFQGFSPFFLSEELLVCAIQESSNCNSEY